MTQKTSPSFSRLAAEYRAANMIADDNSVDEETSFKFWRKGCKIAKKITSSDVVINDRADEIALAKIIHEEIGADHGVFNDTCVEAFVLKLLNNIIGSESLGAAAARA